MKKTSALQYIIIYSLLLMAVAWSIYPILRVITISIRPGDNLLNESLTVIPDDWTFENYIRIFTDHPMLKWIWNSILVTITVVITGVALASTAGYALSRFRFPGREASLLSLLITQMFPATMLLLPLFIMLSNLHLINTYLGLIVIYSSTALPFCV
ncbi:MAG: sugar ABC transporter permease, partial [Candidatus Marinimicrobia bacterium]|nr:sugar ABC transporter permease [Candidatus Neomarinimicrobiota bacterium]